MDIKNIQISLIADEFLVYVEKIGKFDVELAGDFLLMASTLMELKSKALVARNETEKEEVEVRKKILERQIEEYELIKKTASFLDKKAEEAFKSFRVRISATQNNKKSHKEIPDRLFEIFKKSYDELKLREKIYRVKGEKYSVASRVDLLLKRLEEEKEIYIFLLFRSAEDKIDLIVSFLAILEIVKLDLGLLKHFEKEVVLIPASQAVV